VRAEAGVSIVQGDLRHSRCAGVDDVKEARIPSPELIDDRRAEGVVPGELPIGIGIVCGVDKTAGASRVARPEHITGLLPVVLNEEAVLRGRSIVNSAGCLLALEQVPDLLCLLSKNSDTRTQERSHAR